MSQSPRIAIISGASQGIGRATAIRLAQSFTHLVLVARNEAGLHETAYLVNVQYPSVQTLCIPIDLSVPSSASAVVSSTLQTFHTSHINALINIAGAVPQVDLLDMTDFQWDNGFALKLHGARRLTVAAWPALKAASGQSSVVFTSGNSAQAPKAPFAAVATVNAAVVALSRAFADLGIHDSVQVNSVLPGPVMTDRRQSYMRKWAQDQGMSVEEAMRVFPGKTGIQRFGKPEEIAGLIAYLTCSEARWLTGASVRMDGGEIKGI